VGAPHKLVELLGPGWSSGPLVVATTHRARRRGARAVPVGAGVLLRARSVWGPVGAAPLWAISLDRFGVVGGVTLLRPGGFLADRHAVWIAEIPARRPPPEPGWPLTARRTDQPQERESPDRRPNPPAGTRSGGSRP
jgi:hypothetical protein